MRRFFLLLLLATVLLGTVVLVNTLRYAAPAPSAPVAAGASAPRLSLARFQQALRYQTGS